MVILILLINVFEVGQVRPQEHFLNRDTHTGAPALVPFELIQTQQSYNEVSSNLVLLVERRPASEETALSPRTNYQRNETFSMEDSKPNEF